MSKIHLIAIGGAVMHNMAIALHNKGYIVSGSDDEIFEPALSRLSQYGLLPEVSGWNEKRITDDLTAVIVGMHAREDNPELIKAREKGIRIYSFPEYIYEQSKDKKRIVIGGSHGKTTITSMIMHIFRECGINFDYMVGAKLEGFDTMVKLTDSAPIIVLEGDEYLSSPLDPRPKFHLYLPHIALISGIAWDHINVFPTFENYIGQFQTFIKLIREGGLLIYCNEDSILSKLANDFEGNITKLPYSIPEYTIENKNSYLKTQYGNIPLHIFGEHNLMNLEGARLVCKASGIEDKDFYHAISSFKGAAKRLEKVKESKSFIVYKDFAHSPSKLKATVDAVRQQYPNRELVACMELHTFSSLNKEFLSHYAGTMDNAHYPIVYFNPNTSSHKKLPPISVQEVKNAFSNESVQVFNDSEILKQVLLNINWNGKNLLMMSSGNFDGIDIHELSAELKGN